MDPCAHISCRTQPAIVMPSHVRGQKRELKQPEAGGNDVGQAEERHPEQQGAGMGLGGRPLPQAAMALCPAAMAPCPAVGTSQGSGSCRSTLSKPGQQKHYVRKERLPEVCGNSA